MGEAISAKCTSCDYAEDVVVIGGGMREFQKRALWPVRCEACKRIRSANITKNKLSCQTCRSQHVEIYGVVTTQKGGFVSVTGWDDYCLPDTDYRCPRCSQFALRFDASASILFD